MRSLIFFVAFLLASQTSWALQIGEDWENILREQLNSALGNDEFSIESLEVSVAKKELSGIGTFFDKPGVEFIVNYEGESEIGSFTAIMPENAKVSVTNGDLKELGSKKMQAMVPKAISKALYLEAFQIHFSKADKSVERFDLTFNALKNWELLSSASIALEQIKVNFLVHNPTNSKKRKLEGQLKGFTQIAGKQLDLTAKLVENKESLQLSGETSGLEFSGSMQSILGKKSLRGIDLPNNILSLNLKNALFTIAPYQDWLTIAAGSNFGNVEAWIAKSEKKKKETEYVVTISPPKGFKLSQINSKLKSLDAVDLSGQKIVISSADKDKKESSKIPSLSDAKAAIKKGCSLVASIDLTKLKIDHLIGLKNLIVSSPISSHLQHMSLEGAIDKDIAFGESAKLKQVIFRLKPAPSNFAISLLGQMDAQVDDDLLGFKGGVELVLSDQTFNFLALMDGDWNDPLGAKGLRVSDLGIQMGASFTTAPVLLPNIALKGDLKIGSFSANSTVAFDTRNPTKCMLAASFNELNVWDMVKVLTSKQIEKAIPRPMRNTLEDVSFKDVELEVVPVAIQVLEKNYDPGFRAGGKMDVVGFKAEGLFDIDYTSGMLAHGSTDPIDLKIFKLKGANGHERPSLLIDLKKGNTPKFAINGLVGLLGVEGETDIHIIDNGFQFMVGGKIFHLFQGDITAKGKDISRAGDMGIEVKFKNDFFKFLQEDVSSFVENTSQAGVSKLQGAYNNLKAAEEVVRGWDTKIKAKKEEVKKKQAKHRAAFEAAQKKVNAAKAEVNKINKDIQKTKDLAATKTAVKDLPERTYLEGKIKTLQTARLGALGVLEAANLGLEGLKWVNKSPDLDPGVIALKGKKELALKGVQGAQLAIKGVEKGLGAGGAAVSWLLEHGTKGILDIQSAKFAGNLGVISGGAVELELKVAWLGKTQNIRVAFDFNDMVKSVANVGKELLKLG